MRKRFKDWVLGTYQTLVQEMRVRVPKLDRRVNLSLGESEGAKNITTRIPERQGAAPTTTKPATHPDPKNMVDWQRFRRAYLEARKKFLPREGVLGVGFGPRLVNGDEIMAEPSIIILVRKLPVDGLPFPPDSHDFPIIVRKPYVERDEEMPKSNRSHADLSMIDWVKVHRMRKTVTPYFAPPSTVKTTTVGQVFVIQDSKANARGESALVPDPSITGFTAIDWVQAYEYFRQTWGDDYDFVAMYVDIPSGMPNLNNHHDYVFNNVDGINHPLGVNAPRPPEYNSSRLLGLQLMPKDGNSRTIDPTNTHDRTPRNLRLHEISHQWGAYVLPSDLWDNTYTHWGVKFDSDHSSLNFAQNDWDQLSSSSFRELYVPPENSDYCPLDLYLMGMLSPGDPRLTGFYYIDNLNLPYLTNPGDTHTGTQVNLMLQNIVSANGMRQPDAANSPRSFRQAFVLLTKDLNLARDSTKPNVGVLLADIIEKERVAHTTEFRSSTLSRSVLDTYLYNSYHGTHVIGSHDNVYIKDNPSDTGDEDTEDTTVFWDSPDIWVRNAVEDNVTTHQATIRGQDNYIYVRVRNNGDQESGEITVNLFQAHWPGIEFLYPEDWKWDAQHLIGSTAYTEIENTPLPTPVRVPPSSGLLAVPAHGELVIRFKWKQDMIALAAGWHPCLLVEILPIHPDPPIPPDGLPTGKTRKLHHVWENRRIAQKNITIVDPPPAGQPLSFQFQIGARSLPDRWVRVRVQQKEGDPAAEIALDLGGVDWLGRLSKAGFLKGARTHTGTARPAHLDGLATGGRVVQREGRSHFVISDPCRGGDIALPLLEAERKELTLRLHWGKKLPTSNARFEITQLNEAGKILGGLDLVARGRLNRD